MMKYIAFWEGDHEPVKKARDCTVGSARTDLAKTTTPQPDDNLKVYQDIIRSPEFEVISFLISEIAHKRISKVGAILEKIFAVKELVILVHRLGELKDTKKIALEAFMLYPKQTIELANLTDLVLKDEINIKKPLLVNANRLYHLIANQDPKADTEILKVIDMVAFAFDNYSAAQFSSVQPLGEFRFQKSMQAVQSLFLLARDIVKVTPAGPLLVIADLLNALYEMYHEYFPDGDNIQFCP